MAEKKPLPKKEDAKKTSPTGESIGRRRRVISDFTKDKSGGRRPPAVRQKKARRSG